MGYLNKVGFELLTVKLRERPISVGVKVAQHHKGLPLDLNSGNDRGGVEGAHGLGHQQLVCEQHGDLGVADVVDLTGMGDIALGGGVPCHGLLERVGGGVVGVVSLDVLLQRGGIVNKALDGDLLCIGGGEGAEGADVVSVGMGEYPGGDDNVFVRPVELDQRIKQTLGVGLGVEAAVLDNKAAVGQTEDIAHTDLLFGNVLACRKGEFTAQLGHGGRRGGGVFVVLLAGRQSGGRGAGYRYAELVPRRDVHKIEYDLGVGIGGENPIRVQSMLNTFTTDTDACVAQSERLIAVGCEIIRLTTQGVKEAANTAEIKKILREKGYNTPLVADVHFNPAAAEEAALHIEKVRINPGNFANTLEAIQDKFTKFLILCKEHGTAIRIGVNHGSLNPRMMQKYGDTPEGMTESCMEFLRICKAEDFNNVVISVKASNTRIMVQTVRQIVRRMNEEGMNFPLHLGVTEAGEGEDGRIKSAVGIGTLLQEGIGDTIRVSLSEDPEKEIPVAKAIVDFINKG